MNKRRSILSMTGAVVAVVALSGSVMAAGPVVQNTSFEVGAYDNTAYPGWDFDRVSVGDTAIGGWSVTKGNVDWTGNSLWQAADGTKSIDLDGAENTAGAISQTFTTVPNSTYVVTFSMSGNPDDARVGAPSLKTMTTAATGTSAQAYSYATVANDTSFQQMNYVTETYTFIAQSSATTLTFTSTTGSGWGPVIDNVSISQTLAAGANCKKGGWQAMVDSNGTHFRNQGDCVSFYATGEKNLAY